MGYNTLANLRNPVPSPLELCCLEIDMLLPLSGKPCPIRPPSFQLSGIYPSNKLDSGDILPSNIPRPAWRLDYMVHLVLS